MKSSILTVAASLLLGASASASTLLLPSPSGSQPIAAWVGTNAQIVPAPTGDNPNATALDWDGPWTSLTNLAASYSSVGGNFAFNSSLPFNPTGVGSIYTLNTQNSTYSVGASDYAGPAIGKLILQITSTSNNDRHLQMNPSLTIGGTTYSAAQASATFQNSYGGTSSASGFVNDPNSQYDGVYGLMALATYEWDLSALGYTGSFSGFDVSWILPMAHTALYEVQLSVAAVPEPSAFALLAGCAALAGAIALRRRNSLRA